MTQSVEMDAVNTFTPSSSVNVKEDAVPVNKETFLVYAWERRTYFLKKIRDLTKDEISFSDAQDIYQEAIMDGLKGIAKFKGEAKLNTWFFSIVLNRIKMYMRASRAMKSKANTNNLSVDKLQLSHDPEMEKLLDVIKATLEIRNLLEECAGLNGREYVSLLLADCDNQEIADALGIPRSAIRHRMYHLKERVREALSNKKLSFSFADLDELAC